MIEDILDNQSVQEACRFFNVRRLHVFGSVVSGDFADSSDVDFVVEFDREGYAGAFEQFMGFKMRLEEIFGRPVDLLVDKPFRNPIFQESVEKTKRLVYAA